MSLQLEVLTLTPWALVLYPGILSMRGVINGIFSGQLSTGLHMGTITPSIRRNTRYFKVLYCAITSLTLLSGVLTGLAAFLASTLFTPLAIIDLLEVLTVAIATMGFSLAVISPLTLMVSVSSYKLGLDPDFVVYPVMSTVGDILVTLCYMVIINTFLLLDKPPLLALDLAFLITVAYLVTVNLEEREYLKIIREGSLTLILVSIIVLVSGSFLKKISQYIGFRPEIYTVYPALIDTIGDVGAIVGSVTTTKLALGVLRPTLRSITKNSAEILGSWSSSFLMFLSYSLISCALVGRLEAVLSTVKVLAFTNLITVPLIVLMVYLIAISTYRRGWDPDNFVTPLDSTLTDSITTVFLFLALYLVSS